MSANRKMYFKGRKYLLLLSQLEDEVHVLLAVADVNSTEVATASLVVGGVARPDVVSDDGHLTAGVLLDTPHSRGNILADLIEEVLLKDSVVSQEQLFLLIRLHVSEVRVGGEAEALFAGQSSKSHVPFNFVGLSHAKGPLREDLTVVLDGQDCVEESVFLDQAAVDDSLAGILGRGVLKGIALLLGSLSLRLSCRIRVGFILFFNVNVGTVSGEGGHDLVVLFLVLGVHITELFELEVVGVGVVEGLGGELILLAVSNAHGDVVVSAQATHAAPEHQLFEVSVARFVQKHLQGHVEA